MPHFYKTVSSACLSISKKLGFAFLLILMAFAAQSQIESAQTGDWNATSTWVGGFVPSSNQAVLIKSGHFVFVVTGITRNAVTTVDGWFEIKAGGFVVGSEDMTYSSTQGGLVFSHGSTISPNTYGIGNNNKFWPTLNGPYNLILNSGSNVNLDAALPGTRTIAGTATIKAEVYINNPSYLIISGTANLEAGIVANNASALTISGTLDLKAGGFVSNNSPVYTNTSTLRYSNGATYDQNLEWTSFNQLSVGIGSPFNVTVTNSTTVTLTNLETNQRVFGSLNVDAGSTLNTTLPAPFRTHPLFISGALNLNGTLTLSPIVGQDLSVGGNFTMGASSALNTNNRAVLFTGAISPQIITRTGGGSTSLPYTVLSSGSARIVQLAIGTNLNVTAPTGGNAISFTTVGSTIDINGNTLNIGTAGQSVNMAGSATLRGSATSSLSFVTTSPTSNTFNFTPGFGLLQNFTINSSNTSSTTPAAILGNALSVTNLNLTSGILDIANNDLTLLAGGTTTANGTNFIKTSGTGSFRREISAIGTYEFPIGVTTYSYASVAFTAGTFAAGASLGFRVAAVTHPNNNVAATKTNRFWTSSITR